MKTFLLKTLALATALSFPAIYSAEYKTAVSATGEEKQDFSLSFPEFSYVVGQEDGKPVPSANGIEYHSKGRAGVANLPSSFDMREHGTISSVKDQSQYGTCWAHSSAASAESSVIASEPSVNLSELHTAYYSYYGDDITDIRFGDIDAHLDWGGSTENVANLWSQWIGPVYEKRLPYENTEFFELSDKVDEMRYTSDYHLENAYLFDFDNERSNANDINNLIKQFVYNGNSVDVSFYHNSDSYNQYKNCVNSNRPSRFANHSVTIAGWDDNFPAENFSIQPEHDGAWLIKNSWGYIFGEDGYMWISYDDKSLSQFAVYELADKDDYSVNYHHDTFVPSQLLCAEDGTQEEHFSYMANIFTAEDDMQIDAISTYFQNAGTDYEVTIYSGLSNEKNPVSASPSTVTAGHEDLTGYCTIELSESVPVKAGEKFSVVVKLANQENPFVIPVESSLFIKDSKTEEITNIGKYSTAQQIEKYTANNESFYSADGEKWSDICGMTKVYTGEEKAVMLEMLKETIYEGLSEDDTEEMEEADLLYDDYKRLFATGDLCITVGNVSLKAFGSPVGRIKFSHTSGLVPFDEAVELSGAEDIFVSVNDSEYVLYTEPIKITENTKISAYTDPMVITERTYSPAKADFNNIRYRAYDSFGSAEKIADGEYIINLASYDETVQLYPETSAKIIMDGKEITPYTYMNKIEIPYGETDITFELEEEGKISNTVHLRISKNPVSFNLEKELIAFDSDFTVTAEDGKVFENGDNISDYAGQTITAVSQVASEVYTYTVPERAEVPEMEYDYYYETLGFIPNETAEILEYSVADNGYVSAENRLIDGTWINSGMIMNKAFKVIPDEEITLRISAGNGKFASKPVTYKIPSAVSAPEKMPVLTKKDGKYYLSGYDYEIAIQSDTDISELAEIWGYLDEESYLSAMSKRYGIDDIEKLKKIVGSEWRTDYTLESGQTVAVRKASDDTHFASECKFITISKNGDVNDDGFVDAVDASLVAMHYASLSTNGTGTIDENRLAFADYNEDGLVNAVDASEICIYYAKMSTLNNE